jgi:tRNA A-37 threonylcarbamoyl transferase component Bud32
MGMVWAATHLVTRKPVALKMLKPERASDPALRHRFFREARAACAVQHPNIVEIHDVLQLDDGAPVMVMDLLRGESLGSRLDRQPVLPPAEVARLMLPVVSAVGTAHASGVVHRDLKPDNIFLVDEPDGTTSVKVLDFGIAKVLATENDAATTGGLTGTGAMLGTPYYMAPEQIFGERDIDHRADIWAIGVILYECLSGRRPTAAENIGQILKVITTDGIVPLELAAPEVPQDLSRLVRRMLTRDRAARPQSLGEVQAALRRYTDTNVRSFGDPAVPAARPSLPAAGDDGAHALVDSHDGANPLSATKLATTTGKRAAVQLGSGDVSPTAATLASTTASTTADRMMATRSKRRTPLVVGAAVLLAAGLATVTLLRSRTDAETHAVSSVVPPGPAATTASAAATPASAAVASQPGPSAQATPAASETTVAATASAPASASSAPRSKPAAQRTVAFPRPTMPPATTAAPTAPPPATTAAPPGGVVEKPPF